MKTADIFAIIKYPLTTEKSIRIMEAENKMIFVVDRSATKAQIKQAIEELFKTKIANVNTQITPQGHKKAYIKFAPDVIAMDIATNLGLF